MQFTRDDLREKARSLLDVLDREGIYSNEDVRRKAGSKFRSGLLDSVSLSFSPKSTDFAISYVLPDGTVLIELRINETLNYSQIVARCQERVEGYSPLFESPLLQGDCWDNLFNHKKMDSSDFLLAIGEVASLAK